LPLLLLASIAFAPARVHCLCSCSRPLPLLLLATIAFAPAGGQGSIRLGTHLTSKFHFSHGACVVFQR
jgi:hypothetical protein